MPLDDILHTLQTMLSYLVNIPPDYVGHWGCVSLAMTFDYGRVILSNFDIMKDCFPRRLGLGLCLVLGLGKGLG